MPKLNFSPEQRFIIAMLCELYKDPKQRELDPDFIDTAVSGGHDWMLDWDLPGVFPEETDTEQQVHYVSDVLNAWEFIELSYSKLGGDDQQKIKDNVAYIGKNGPQFMGFDGNNETKYMVIARMLIEKMGRFSSFKGRDLNSHGPTADRYQEIVEKFEPMLPGLARGLLTADQIIELLTWS